MLKPLLAIIALQLVAIGSMADTSSEAALLKQISQQKWQWMADKDVTNLEKLFHEDSKFVHMSGTWKKAAELDIIETGSIWYKHAEVHDMAVEIVSDTAIVWNRITLEAVVREMEVSNEFTVTEVYLKNEGNWQLLGLTFSKVRDTHKIEH